MAMDFIKKIWYYLIMIGFLIRKTLYDLWDNMFKVVILNLMFLACIAIPIFLPELFAMFTDSFVLQLVLRAIGILACSVFLSTAAYTIKAISDYSTFSFKEFFMNFKKAWLPGIFMGVFVVFLFIVLTIVLPFYVEMEPVIVGLGLAAVIFWAVIFSLISFQYFFTVYTRLGKNSIRKTFRKCMIISLDNTGLSIFMILHNLLVLLISMLFAMMFPGPVGVLLYLDEALRLRLLKYDYLEENPDANRRKIPWDALLIDEREKTGTRSFRSFIFPWKD